MICADEKVATIHSETAHLPSCTLGKINKIVFGYVTTVLVNEECRGIVEAHGPPAPAPVEQAVPSDAKGKPKVTALVPMLPDVGHKLSESSCGTTAATTR